MTKALDPNDENAARRDLPDNLATTELATTELATTELATTELATTELATSLWRQRMFVIAGCVALVLALIGAVLPVMPSTPFVLLASACFMRGSSRMHRALRNNRWFGASLRQWEEQRFVPRKTKILAVCTMLISLTLSGVFFVDGLGVRIALAVIGIVMSTLIMRLPDQPRPCAARALSATSRPE